MIRRVPFVVMGESLRPLSGEEKLWTAVIRQAIIDAHDARPSQAAQRADARAFLANSTGALGRICARLNLDLHYVQREAALRGAGSAVTHYATRRERLAS